jgi:hypothetical protein
LIKRTKIKNQTEIDKRKILQDLDSYIKFRRKREGRKNGLDLDFYVRHFNAGVRNFIGVRVDEEEGLIEDTQNPDTFNEYKSFKDLYPNGTI